MSNDNTQRRNRARAALRAVPTHYGENEEGITDAITDLLHLAAKQGVDVKELLSRCHNNYETETAGEEEAKTNQHYALVVVIEAASPEQAWEAVHGTVGNLEGDGEPDCIYIGAPWQGIPAEAEDLSTECLRVGMSLPDRDGDFLAATKELRPCE